jgi:hypothetical protein
MQRNYIHQHVFTAFLGIKTSFLGWQFRLEHPSYDVVSRVINKFQLPVSSNDFNKNVVCVSCQLRKGKKLHFSSSNCVSTAPLQFIHSAIWTSPI